MALLFVAEAEAELQEIVEDLLNIAAAVVVAVDQLLELGGEVGAGWIELDEVRQLSADRGFERLNVCVLVG